jgi:sec-independent protein translocase protein TatA
MNRIASALVALFAVLGSVNAFAPTQRTFGVPSRCASPASEYQPAAMQRQRQSMASVQTMGLFGLGAPEIGVILVAAAFLLGPEKLAEFGKDAGKIAGELKEVPKEFQQGMKEGEAQAKAIKAKEAAAETIVAETIEEKKSE